MPPIPIPMRSRNTSRRKSNASKPAAHWRTSSIRRGDISGRDRCNILTSVASPQRGDGGFEVPSPWRKSGHRRDDLGEAVVGRGDSLLDARIEMAVAIFLGLVQDGRCQRGLAAMFGECRRDLVFFAAKS